MKSTIKRQNYLQGELEKEQKLDKTNFYGE
jgi:hypothetical protein